MEETTEEITTARASRTPLIALGVALLLCLIAAFTFYGNWRETEQRLQASQLEQQTLAKDSYRVSNLIQKTKADREAVADPAYKAVVLRGTSKSSSSLAVAYYNPTSRELLLDVNRLPEPPAGMQYQFWAMTGSTPTDAGVVGPEKMNEGLMKMNAVGGASSFMMTLEKAGGVQAPSNDQIYLTGGL